MGWPAHHLLVRGGGVLESGNKSNLSPAISHGFAGRNLTGRELKLLYATRATRGYWNHKILPRFGFSWKPRKGGVPGNHAN